MSAARLSAEVGSFFSQQRVAQTAMAFSGRLSLGKVLSKHDTLYRFGALSFQLVIENYCLCHSVAVWLLLQICTRSLWCRCNASDYVERYDHVLIFFFAARMPETRKGSASHTGGRPARSLPKTKVFLLPAPSSKVSWRRNWWVSTADLSP